jgi:membrane fusion protein (multidrug efflux system)
VNIEVLRPVEIGGTVSAVGTVLSNEEVQVRSQVSGQIEKIAFGEGARVARGAVLVKINDDELQAQLSRAKSRTAIAEQQAERQKQLFEKQFISQEEYNNAINELNVVRADGQLIEAQIAKSEITAPFDGTIGLRFVSEGSYVSPATVITTLQDNARMKVDFTIPEKYARMIGKGDSIRFSVQTRQESYSARIYSTDSRIDPATRTLRVRAATVNPGGVLLPGAFASVVVSLNPRKALTVPAYALIPELRGNKVFVCRGGKAESRPVVIGERSNDRVEIASGLAAGDTLITSGILQLRPGMDVTPAQGGGGTK